LSPEGLARLGTASRSGGTNTPSWKKLMAKGLNRNTRSSTASVETGEKKRTSTRDGTSLVNSTSCW
jgi:hypothetical protein